MHIFSRLTMFSCLTLAASFLSSGPLAAGQGPSTAPSINCKHAKNQAEQIICATPELAALDRELVNVLSNILYRTRYEVATMIWDEGHWQSEVRDACTNAACLKEVYEKRIQQLRSVAYDENRPFPVSDSLWAEARSYIGKSCTADLSTGLNGFEKVKGFHPVTARDAVVQVRAKQGTRFAFLLITKDDKSESCRIADVIALPSSTVANTFLACNISDRQSHGIGMRLIGERLPGFVKVLAYWEIDAQEGKLLRQPLAALGEEKSMHCNSPESRE